MLLTRGLSLQSVNQENDNSEPLCKVRPLSISGHRCSVCTDPTVSDVVGVDGSAAVLGDAALVLQGGRKHYFVELGPQEAVYTFGLVVPFGLDQPDRLSQVK